jgi:hypothetical protein
MNNKFMYEIVLNNGDVLKLADDSNPIPIDHVIDYVHFKTGETEFYSVELIGEYYN